MAFFSLWFTFLAASDNKVGEQVGWGEGAVDGWNRQNGLSTVLQIQLCHNINCSVILLSQHITRDLRRLRESEAKKDYLWSKYVFQTIFIFGGQ